MDKSKLSVIDKFNYDAACAGAIDKSDDYQKMTNSTAIYPTEGLDDLVYTTLGLVGEAGEIANKVKKIIRDCGGVLEEERAEDIRKELGDVCWYMAQMSEVLNTTLSKIQSDNIKKLLERKMKDTIKGSGDDR